MSHFHEDTEIFAQIVDNRGFSHAARKLGISPALVSRRVRALEKNFGVTLLTRSTRKFELTPEGILLYQHAKKVLNDKRTILQSIENLASKPAGHLRISAPMNFGRQHMATILCQFSKIYPEIEIDLQLSNTQTDIIDEKFDLVIRGAGYTGQQGLTENNFIAKRLLSSTIILCASPDFLQRHPKLESIKDLQGLMGLDFNPTHVQNTTTSLTWDGTLEKKTVTITLKKQFSCNDIDTTIKMACEGNGIAKVATINIDQELKTKALIPIFPTLDLGLYHLYAVVPQRTLPQRTRKLLEFLAQQWS